MVDPRDVRDAAGTYIFHDVLTRHVGFAEIQGQMGRLGEEVGSNLGRIR